MFMGLALSGTSDFDRVNLLFLSNGGSHYENLFFGEIYGAVIAYQQT
jgi:hypothetical protein